MMEQVQFQLKAMRLSGMAAALPLRVQEAIANELPHLDFLAQLLHDESDKRKTSLLQRRLTAARFPELKTLENFDFAFNPAINKRQMLELASAHFVSKAQNVLLLGPPGVGKTHLAVALGLSAIHAGYSVLYCSVFDLVEDFAERTMLGERKPFLGKLLKPHLLILDEFGMRKLPAHAAEDLLELFHRRYQHGATLIATNRPLEDWSKILGDNAATAAILDRLLEGIHLIKISGKSYRLKTAGATNPEQETVARQKEKS